MSSLLLQSLILLVLSVGTFCQNVTLHPYNQSDSTTSCAFGLIEGTDSLTLKVTVENITASSWSLDIQTNNTDGFGDGNILCTFRKNNDRISCDNCTCTYMPTEDDITHNVAFNITPRRSADDLFATARWYEQLSDIRSSNEIDLPPVYHPAVLTLEFIANGSVVDMSEICRDLSGNHTVRVCVTNLVSPFAMMVNRTDLQTLLVNDDMQCLTGDWAGVPASVWIRYTEFQHCKRDPRQTFHLCTNTTESNECPESCMNNECHQGNGSCVACQSLATFGALCNSRCNPSCLQEGLVCDRFSGRCSACPAGFYGEMCELRCSNSCPLFSKVCDRDTGKCDACRISSYYGALLTTFIWFMLKYLPDLI